MHEKKKLAEAKYFLERMRVVESNYNEFLYNLSAFLSSTRTITQYIIAEVKKNKNVNWYETKMNNSDILKFFISTRNLNIHVVPCRLEKNVEEKSNPIKIDLIFSPVAISSTGEIVYGSSINIAPNNQCETISIHKYKFDVDWYNQKNTKHYTLDDKQLCQRLCQTYDVITFCEVHIDELESMVNEGIRERKITG